MEKKVTKNDMFAYLINVLNGNLDTDERITTDAAIKFCEKEIEAIAAKREKAKNYKSKKREQGDALADSVSAVLTDDFATINDILDCLDNEEATSAKVAYRLNKLVADGVAEKGNVAVNGRKLVAYRKIAE